MARRGRVALGALATVLCTGTTAHAQPEEEEPPTAAPVEASPEPPAPEPPAPPEPPPPPLVVRAPARLGARHQFVFDSATSLGVTVRGYADSPAFSVGVGASVGVDFFVLENVSVGLVGGMSWSLRKSYRLEGNLIRTESVGRHGGIRAGIVLPLSRVLSLYPRVTVGLEHVETESFELLTRVTAVRQPPLTMTTAGVWTSAFVPLVLEPAPHFFVGVGPSVFAAFDDTDNDPYGSGHRRALGVQTLVGGTIGGDESSPEPAREREESSARFGDRGQWVFTGDVGAAAHVGGNENNDGSGTSVIVAPGADYLFDTQVSAGASAFVSYDLDRAPTPSSGERARAMVMSFGGEARMGVEIPFSRPLSLYPRASVGVERAHETGTSSSGASIDEWSTALYVSLYAPLLVHVAQHAFVGFGPFVSHELTRHVDDAGRHADDLVRTTGGARFVVGGWL